MKITKIKKSNPFEIYVEAAIPPWFFPVTLIPHLALKELCQGWLRNMELESWEQSPGCEVAPGKMHCSPTGMGGLSFKTSLPAHSPFSTSGI